MATDDEAEDESRTPTTQGEVTFTRFALDQLLSVVSETLLGVDDAGTITYVNPRVRDLLGIEPSEAEGRSILSFLRPEDVEWIAGTMERWVGRAGITQPTRPLHVRHADGSWVEVRVDRVTGLDGSGIGGTVIALTRTTPAAAVEWDLRRRLVNEDRLTRLATMFLETGPEQFDEVLDGALAELATLEGVDRVSVWRSVRGRFKVTATWTAPGARLAPLDDLGAAFPVAGGGFVSALEARREVRLPDATIAATQPDDPLHADATLLAGLGVRAFLAAALTESVGVVGFLAFEAARTDNLFSPSHLSTARTAAGILGHATARHVAEATLTFQARNDSVTGLGNRWSFLEAVADALADHDGDHPGVAVLLADLDRFKVVNDALGHSAGDDLLRIAAQRIAGATEPGETVARLGGDEFVVVCPGLTDRAAALERAERVRTLLAVPATVGDQLVQLTASVGVAFADDPAVEPSDLLRQADAAMYAAKSRGRDRVELLDDDLRERVERQFAEESALRAAIAEGQLRLHYQPEVTLPGGEVVAAEALVRWEHPERGLLTAEAFIALAEESGAIADLGRWVLAEACRQLAAWEPRLPDGFVLRVNLSARQVTQRGIADEIAEVVAAHGVDPSRLCLELTETALLADAAAALANLEKLRAFGIGAAIDDFGTGYSSLSHLKRFPVAGLKIDRSFVDGLGRDPDDDAIVAAIVGLAAALDLGVTAEGVEAEAQAAALVALGCTRAQGFLFGRAVPAHDFERMLPDP